MSQTHRSILSVKIPEDTDYVRCSTPNQRISSPYFEKNDNGDMEYTYKIDVSDFRPEEVKIKQSQHTLTIDASCSRSSKSCEDSSTCSRSEKKEYHKTISLPQNADLSKNLDKEFVNGMLIIKVPMVSSIYSPGLVSPAVRSYSPLLSRDKSVFSETSIRSGRQIYSEKLKLDPDFSKEDVKINTNDQVVVVTASQKRVDSNGCTSSKNYSSEHKFPANVDLQCLQADWSIGELTLSAPYKF